MVSTVQTGGVSRRGGLEVREGAGGDGAGAAPEGLTWPGEGAPFVAVGWGGGDGAHCWWAMCRLTEESGEGKGRRLSLPTR